MKKSKTSDELKQVETMAMVITSLRDEKGWSQAELAEAAGVSDGAIKMIETKRRMPRLDTAFKIAKALGCTLESLIVSQGEQPKQLNVKGPRKSSLREVSGLLDKLAEIPPDMRNFLLAVLHSDISYLDGAPKEIAQLYRAAGKTL